MFTAQSFDALLAQSFFSNVIPTLCEALVCGQTYQTFYTIEIPELLVGKRFTHLFRTMMARHVLTVGLYRAPSEQERAHLYYVALAPSRDTVLQPTDKVLTQY